MSEKRPDSGLDEEMKRKLKLDGSASGSAANDQETLKASMEKRNQDFGLDEEMKRKVKLDGSASGSVSNQETLKPALKPATGKGNEDKQVKKNVKFDVPERGSVGKQETLKPPMGKRSNQDKEMKSKLRLDGSASASGKRNQVDEGSFKAKMAERSSSSTSLWLPRSSSKDQTPPALKHLHSKRLTYDDLQTGTLKLPRGMFSDKVRDMKQDRMMVPFLDNRGVMWDLEFTLDGLTYNWDKFVSEHRLKYNDEILFYEDDRRSFYYIIDYKRDGDVSVGKEHSKSR